MIDYVLFFFEAKAAKQRLARLIQSEELVPGNQLSSTVVAANSSCADPIAIKQTTDGKKISWWQKQCFRRPSRYHEDRAVAVSGQRAQLKRIDADHLGTAFRNQAPRRWPFIMPKDWTWWIWLITACLLLSGLRGMLEAFLAALLLSIAQSVLFFARERTIKAFPVQLRLAYTLLLIICFFPSIRWLYWLPAVGTFALVIFGYCLMARALSLLPWNRTEPIAADLLRRTFLSRPRLLDWANNLSSTGCGASLCSIEAQVEPAMDQAGRTLADRS